MTVNDSANAESSVAKILGPVCFESEAIAARIKQFDSYITQFHSLGFVNRTIIVGPIVMRRSYGLDGPSDSGQLIQAAITTDHGVVAVIWDSEDYATSIQESTFDEDALDRARPLRECAPAVRSRVMPYVGELVLKLINCVD